MDDEIEYDEYELEAPSRRFRKQDLLVMALDATYNIAMALTSSIAMARNLAGMHANYVADQDSFRREAALEIETLIAGDSIGE